MVWTKFAPAQYNSTYFMYNKELQEWHMDRELLIMVQTGIERLQNVISDVIAIVGNEDHRFVIDREGKLAEQLWMSKQIEELRMADKLLKLRVELTFAQLYKLRKLHQGKSLSTPMASEDSLPPTPELRECLYKAWHNPRLPTKRVARRALASGWEAIQGDINGMRPIIQATRHPFTGNQAMKYAEYDVRLEEVLDVQPLPRVDTDPHGLGLFMPSSDFKEPSGDASFDPSHSPKAGPGSIINLPAWPTPPSDQMRLGNLSTYRASSIDLDTSPLTWQDIPSTIQHPGSPSRACSPLTNYLIGRANAVGEGIEYPGVAWDSVTDTPALPAPGATRTHDYYTNLVKAAPFSLSCTLFSRDLVGLSPSEQEGPSTILRPPEAPPKKKVVNLPWRIPRARAPSLLLLPTRLARRKAEVGRQMMMADLGMEEEARDEEAQIQGSLPMEDPRAQVVLQALLALLDLLGHLEHLPEWDGDQETAIDWLYECSDLVSLGPAVESQIAQIATFRFRGAIATAWQAHSAPVKHSILQSWDNLREWVLHRYLGEACANHPDESPAKYIQWCILLLRIFLRFTPNSPEETVSVMNNAPTEWDVVLRWSNRPPIESVLMHAKQFEATLVTQWRSTQHYRCRQDARTPRRVNFVTQEDTAERAERESLHSQYSDDPEGAFFYSSEEAEEGEALLTAFSVGKHPGSKSYRPPCCSYPQGKRADNIEKTYPYPQDDTVVSHHKPGQKCFACGSEKHWVRDCKHFRAYSNHLERKMLKKEHRRYKTPDYKVAYSVMVDATPNF
ncbi:hypothetical protein BS47DRAFT_1387278 [Hydnum rufescens UP504]|uniref:CCHC-type domain-containing protein n=1 Tax=Hydnum rufescens UP504 TaxID=1448309 RepID=A0A9P6BAE3_9AGAM|nr:hypothetical protein BS47DRAFT_1387278 [Hydnum rufescens UP504]